MEPGPRFPGHGARCRPRPRRRGPEQRSGLSALCGPARRCGVPVRPDGQGRDGTCCTGRKSGRGLIPGRVHPGNRPYYVFGLVTVRPRAHGVPRGCRRRDRPDRRPERHRRTAGPACRRARSVRPVPTRTTPTDLGAAGDASQTPASTAVTTALGPLWCGLSPTARRPWHRLQARPSASTGAGPEAGTSGIPGSTGHPRPQRPGRRAWTLSCGLPGQQAWRKFPFAGSVWPERR